MTTREYFFNSALDLTSAFIKCCKLQHFVASCNKCCKLQQMLQTWMRDVKRSVRLWGVDNFSKYKPNKSQKMICTAYVCISRPLLIQSVSLTQQSSDFPQYHAISPRISDSKMMEKLISNILPQLAVLCHHN